MSAISASMQPVSASSIAYTDINALQDIGDDEAGATQAAQQFESLFLGIMLKSMRDANAALAEDSLFSSSEVEMHQEMLDQQWAIHIAESGGLGLADVIVDQLLGRDRSPGAALSELQVGAADSPPVVAGSSPIPVSVSGYKAPAYESRAAFVSALLPELESMLADSGLEPLRVLAQSVLETGWGQKLIHDPGGRNSHSLFGIKADSRWQGESVEVRTLEVVAGQPEVRAARFRSYPSPTEAIRDYLDFLGSNPRYGKVVSAQDDAGFADALQRSGYATDPGYAGKLRGVMGSIRSLLGIEAGEG